MKISQSMNMTQIHSQLIAQNCEDDVSFKVAVKKFKKGRKAHTAVRYESFHTSVDIG